MSWFFNMYDSISEFSVVLTIFLLSYNKSCKKCWISPRITQHCVDTKTFRCSSACLLRNVAVVFDRFPYFFTAEPSHVEDHNYLFLSGRLPMVGQHNTYRSLSAFIYGRLPTAVIIAPTSFKLLSKISVNRSWLYVYFARPFFFLRGSWPPHSWGF
jgi:hypothetical protein